jgi:hypothetical protein
LNLGGYTHNAMIKRGSADFVSAVANNPKRALEHMGIAVRQIPLDSFPSGQRFFTEAQYEDFFASITRGIKDRHANTTRSV